MKKLFSRLHPYLFTVVSLLFVYAGARLVASPLQIIRPLIIMWVLLLLLTPICQFLVGNKDWANIFLSVFVFAFYFRQSIFLYFGLLTLVIIVAAILLMVILKKKIIVQQIALSLSAFSSSVVIVQIVLFFFAFLPIPFSYYQNMVGRSGELSLPLSNAVQEKPDIYYIIVDGYPRADILKDIYNYDNTSFIRELEGIGFTVPSNSHSNYSRTALSIASTLDMQYWDSISPGMEDAFFWWLTKHVMDHSRLRESLESIGYQYVSIASDWGITNNSTAGIYLKPYPFILSDYENYLISSTPLRVLYSPFQRFSPVTTNAIHREYIMYNLETLQHTFRIPGPKFVFSHIIVPHPPFVFSENGDPIDPSRNFTFDSPDSSNYSVDEYKERYIGQVIFTNRQILRVVQEIQANSAIPPIIIIQADHGSAVNVDFDDLAGSCMKERFAVFAAYYLPDTKQGLIPGDISAVNIFRLVLNQYFDAQLEILDDRQYFTNGYSLFDLTDVTDRVGDACQISHPK